MLWRTCFVALLHSRRNRLATRTIGTSRRNKLLGVVGLFFESSFKSFVIVECIVIISWWSFLKLNMACQIWFITAYFCFSLCLSITVIGMNNSVCFQNISTEVGHNWVTYLLLCIYTLRTCNILCRLTVLFLSFINALQVL